MMKRTLSLLLTACMLLALLSLPANAYMYPASPASGNLNIGTYLCGSRNVSAYADSSLTVKTGSVYPSDYVTILTAAGNAVQVRYPVSGGGSRTGWIAASAVSPGRLNSGFSLAMRAGGSAAVYRRETGSETIGSIARGDTVYLVFAGADHCNGRAQFIYPISGGWKMGFCSFADIESAAFRAVGGGQTVNDGLYRISVSPTHSVDGAGEGNDVHVWEDLDVPQQKVQLRHLGGGEYAVTFQTGLCLDQFGNVESSSTVIAQEANGGRNQRWYIADLGGGRYCFFNCRSGLALDVYCYQTQSNGADILAYQYNGQSQTLTRLDGGAVASSGQSAQGPASSASGSDRQRAMADAALAMVGRSGYSGLCQKFVRVVGESIGLPGGGAASALDACGRWRVSGSSDNIPLGAAVYLRSRNTAGAGYQYGHVGVYVGNGQVVHALAAVRVDALSSLMKNYSFLGWGWQAGVDLR